MLYFATKRDCFKSFEDIGLKDYDSIIIEGIIRRQIKLNEAGNNNFTGFASICTPQPDGEVLARECQTLLKIARKNAFFNDDKGNHYEDYLAEDYGDIFDPEQRRAIIEALANKNYIRKDFDVSAIGKLLSETVLGSAVPTIQDYSSYGKFVDEFYEHISLKPTLNRGLFEEEIKRELPPPQYEFILWLDKSNYKVAGCKIGCSSKRIKIVRRDNPDERLVMEKASLRNAQSAVKNLMNWVGSLRFMKVLERTIS